MERHEDGYEGRDVIPIVPPTRRAFTKTVVVDGVSCVERLEFDVAGAETGPGWLSVPYAPGVVARTQISPTASDASTAASG